MSTTAYLQGLLLAQRLTDEQKKDLSFARNEVEAALRTAFGSSPRIRQAGSKAKNTMIRESYDLDLTVYFPSDHHHKSLQDIYEDVERALQAKFQTARKTSAIRIRNLRNPDGRFYHVDVVPGRFVSGKEGDAFLYWTKRDGNRIKTNLDRHREFIEKSGRENIIRLSKLWVHRNEIPFRTFALEIFVVEKIDDLNVDDLGSGLRQLFEALHDEIETTSLRDPANPSNNVADLMEPPEKLSIRMAAEEALRLMESDQLTLDYIARLFKEPPPSVEDLLKSMSLLKSMAAQSFALDESAIPSRPLCDFANDSNVDLEIEATVYKGPEQGGDPRHRQKKRVARSGETIPSSRWILFKAVTKSMPKDAYIEWQVVNTGPYADGNRRGEFLPSDEKNNSRWEWTRFTGTHVMRCFILHRGKCIKEAVFYVKVRNPEQQTTD